LVALRMLVAFLPAGHGFGRLDQLLLVGVGGGLVAALLYRFLDDVERLPAAEHVGVGRDVLVVLEAGAVVVDADRGAIGLVGLALVGLGVAWIGLPEMGAIEELEAWARDVHRFE